VQCKPNIPSLHVRTLVLQLLHVFRLDLRRVGLLDLTKRRFCCTECEPCEDPSCIDECKGGFVPRISKSVCGLPRGARPKRVPLSIDSIAQALELLVLGRPAVSV
jgi:hypothetical protein